MRVGIDFDGVLFDVEAFKHDLYERLDDFEATYPDAKQDGLYRPRRHAELMGIEYSELVDVFACAADHRRDLDPLTHLSSHTLILVTRGSRPFQQLKVELTRAGEYFDEAVYVEKSIEALPKDRAVQLDFLVDDKKDEVEAVTVPTFHFTDQSQLSDIQSRIEKSTAGG